MTKRVVVVLVTGLLAACGSSSASGLSTPQTDVTVFAAASLQPAFDKIGARLLTTKRFKTTFSYAGTQTLTSQLTQGAQADVFASADKEHMNTLLDAGLVAAPLAVFATNKLEIAVARGNPKGIHTLTDLARPGLVVVLADPSVPAGKYAQQALRNARVTVKPASLELQVTGVLSKVALGEADAGIVYVSDIVTSGKVDGVSIPDDENVTAVYPIAPLKSATNPAGAKAFIDLVLSTDGQAILKAAGFQGV
ncbi:MAG TPA: molybdate ABC transporter substrate-binding protein [Candidatus Dormibacteraeota bacterium]|nr:molybdate ABC transporter substrate-binding protein [Candidatus Dormibacteraeota bacterium]